MYTTNQVTMASAKTFKWDYREIRDGSLVLRAVNHKLRQRMLDIIYTAGSINVTDLYIKLRIEQCVCSAHLRILRKAGLVTAERTGKFINYSVNADRVNGVMQLIGELGKK